MILSSKARYLLLSAYVSVWTGFTEKRIMFKINREKWTKINKEYRGAYISKKENNRQKV